jgi:cell division protein FtsB
MKKLLGTSGAHRRRRARTRRPLPRLSLPRPPRPTVAGLRLSRLKPSVALAFVARFRTPEQRPVERRRARALLLVAVVFSALVLLTALPWTTLLNQHTQLSSATAEVNALQAENKALAVQAHQLSGSSTQSALARQDYGLVKPGQTAYDILPPAGSSSSGVTEAGHVPLDEAPVVPGSRRSEELLGAGVVNAPSSSTSRASTETHVANAASAPSSESKGSGGFWSRVGHTLEFWN